MQYFGRIYFAKGAKLESYPDDGLHHLLELFLLPFLRQQFLWRRTKQLLLECLQQTHISHWYRIRLACQNYVQQQRIGRRYNGKEHQRWRSATYYMGIVLARFPYERKASHLYRFPKCSCTICGVKEIIATL